MHTFSEAVDLAKEMSFPVGENSNGEIEYADLHDLSNLLIAGATGFGKSVFLHSLLLSVAFHNTPASVRFILFDSKVVELAQYSHIPHMMLPLITDERRLESTLVWLEKEAKRRLQTFAESRVKNIVEYNDFLWKNYMEKENIPEIIVVIDDLSAATMNHLALCDSIKNILLIGRTVGIHLIAVTQTPTWKNTKNISALFQSKMVFSAASLTESKFLLGKAGAEFLAGDGDAMFSRNGSLPIRVHALMASSREADSILTDLAIDAPQYDDAILLAVEPTAPTPSIAPKHNDDILLPAAIDILVESGQASVSMLERRLKISFSKAAQLVDQLEKKGVVGPFLGDAPRALLITKEQWQDMTFRKTLRPEGSVRIDVSIPVPEVNCATELTLNPQLDLFFDDVCYVPPEITQPFTPTTNEFTYAPQAISPTQISFLPNIPRKKRIPTPVKIIIATLFVAMVYVVIVSCSIQATTSSTGKISDKELIYLNGHPKIFDTLSDSKYFYRNHTDQVSVVEAHESMYERDHLILMSGYPSKLSNGDLLIHSIRLNFKDSDMAETMTLDEAIKIALEYLPMKLIDENYTFKRAFVYGSEDGSRKT